MKKNLYGIAALVALATAPPGFAGLYTDDLSRCIVDSTTTEDRANLMKWVYIAMSQHPMVASLTTAKPADMDAANKIIGQLLTRLLTDSCVQKAKDAIRVEGAGAIQASFQVLGQVAASGLFSDPNVVKGMAGLEQYADKKKLDELSKAPTAEPAK